MLDSLCRKLLPCGKVNVKMIYDIVLKFDEDVGSIENFCRLYLLLGISQFLFQIEMELFSPFLFALLMIYTI